MQMLNVDVKCAASCDAVFCIVFCIFYSFAMFDAYELGNHLVKTYSSIVIVIDWNAPLDCGEYFEHVYSFQLMCCHCLCSVEDETQYFRMYVPV